MYQFYSNIYTVSLEEALANPEQVILEVISRRLPKDVKQKLRKPTVRREMLEKYGEKAFLLPEELKFPVVDPDTGKYDCRLIYAAYIRANQWKTKRPEYAVVTTKAKQLYEKQKCEEKIGIQIRETGEIIEAADFAEWLVALTEEVTSE